MKCFRPRLVILQCVVVFFLLIKTNGADDPIVPALCIFGDSVMDVGNNNHRLFTLLRANFLPYGRDFVTHEPTGRFCNGKLAVDYIADYLEFKSYPQPYLDMANETLLRGANFASAGSGYYDKTSLLHQAISLPQQIENYEKWQNQVMEMVGSEKANEIFSGGIHILSAGSSDFLQNYYINPLLRALHTPSEFSNMLLKRYSRFIKRLYSLGVKKIGVTTLPPTGCLPVAITLFGRGRNNCVARLNKDALKFNKKLNATSQKLVKRFPDLRLVVFDIYHPLLNIIRNPVENGFFESRRGCCGTGLLATSILCNERSIGTCSNATSYVFWDAFHTSESANEMLAKDIFRQVLSSFVTR